MRQRAWLPSVSSRPCPFLLLLLLLVVPRVAQPQAGRNHTESPGPNVTVTRMTPMIPATSGNFSTSIGSDPEGEAETEGPQSERYLPSSSSSPLGGQVLTESGQPCRFPFRYGGRMLHSCTSEGSAYRKWCATTHNYDRDRAWGYCEEATLPVEGPAVLDPCASGPCLNGGTCSSTQDHVSYHCACPLAFTGKDCGTGEGTSGTQEWGLSGRLGEQRLSPAWGGRCLPGRGDLHECCGSIV